MFLGIVLEECLGEGNVGGVRGQCPDTVPEWHKRNLVTLGGGVGVYYMLCNRKVEGSNLRQATA